MQKFQNLCYIVGGAKEKRARQLQLPFWDRGTHVTAFLGSSHHWVSSIKYGSLINNLGPNSNSHPDVRVREVANNE